MLFDGSLPAVLRLVGAGIMVVCTILLVLPASRPLVASREDLHRNTTSWRRSQASRSV